jgi:hypothetical protein
VRWREPGDNRQEAVAPQRLQVEFGGRPNHGRTRHSAQQRDLSEPIPWTEGRDHATVSDYIGRAYLDCVEAVRRITLLKNSLAGGHLDWFQAAGQLFDGRAAAMAEAC